MNTDSNPTQAATTRAALDTDIVDDEQPTHETLRRGTHPFDPISAVLGILACLAGALTITGTLDPFGADDAGVWVAAAVATIGIAMLPWGLRSRLTPTRN